jgi:uncharacterized protein YutE (UPF0331/DUF86 family)
MVQVELVRDKIRRLRETAAAPRSALPAEAAWLTGRDARDLVSFRVYLGVQEAIDVASQVIADEGWGPAPSLRDHFTILATRGVLEHDLAETLAASVKIRNLIGHAYAEVDPVKLHAAATELLAVLEAFSARVLAHAEQRASAG